MLQVFANNKPLVLPEDFSLDFSLKNPMFNNTESYSYPVSVPFEGNRHLLSNIDSRNSVVRPVTLERTPMQINVSGVPVFVGEMETSDDEELTGEISVNAVSGQDFKQMIADLECKDIPVKDKIIIGEKLGTVTTESLVDEIVKMSFVDGVTGGDRSYAFTADTNVVISGSFTPPALGFCIQGKTKERIEEPAEWKWAVSPEGVFYPVPTIKDSYINVDKPYPFPYCNARVAYKHYALGTDGKTADFTMDDPYMVLEADRPASGICFYVLYFLDCLFEYLGLDWDNSELLKIEDMKRLCFFTTKCSYDEEPVPYAKDSDGNDITVHEYKDFTEINSWLSSHGCGTTLAMTSMNGDEAFADCGTVKIKKGTGLDFRDPTNKILQDDVIVSSQSTAYVKVQEWVYNPDPDNNSLIPIIKDEAWLKISLQAGCGNVRLQGVTAEYCRMYANSGNFPSESVSSLINSLENQFGIRFVYDPETKKVTARLLREMYRSTKSPRRFTGHIAEVTPVVEKTTGVRIRYSEENDKKEQRNNLRDKVKDYSLDYDYIDYPDPSKVVGMSGISVARTTEINKTYKDIIPKAIATDNTCYIDQYTGNAYRVKINSEVQNQGEAKPAYFEAGGYKGLELGDCSERNEDNIIEFVSDFKPVLMSDVNAKRVMAAAATQNPLLPTRAFEAKENQPILSAFIDEDMEHEYTAQILAFPADNSFGILNTLAVMRTRESYDPSKSDSGGSPLQDIDWGLAISIMRGGGTDTNVQVYDPDYDGCGNYRWMTTVGTYAMTSDSIDLLGNEYDYNGKDLPGIVGEHFSLKIRAYKQPEWADAPLCRDDYVDSNGKHYIRSRGTGDRFMLDHAYFILNRRKFIVRGFCEPAVLVDIREHWENKWQIGNKVGYIDAIEAVADNKSDTLDYTITFYEI